MLRRPSLPVWGWVVNNATESLQVGSHISISGQFHLKPHGICSVCQQALNSKRLLLRFLLSCPFPTSLSSVTSKGVKNAAIGTIVRVGLLFEWDYCSSNRYAHDRGRTSRCCTGIRQMERMWDYFQSRMSRRACWKPEVFSA
jgi:hypothetical protein